MLTIVVMGSGFATLSRPGTTESFRYRPSHFGARFSENAFGPSI
jgi:hypothetical protein